MSAETIWILLTLASLAVLTALCWWLWPRNNGRCDFCTEPLKPTGHYEDSEGDGRFCSLVCAYQRSSGLIEWHASEEPPEWRQASEKHGGGLAQH